MLFLHRHLDLAALGEVDLAVVVKAAEGFERKRVGAGLVGAVEDVGPLALESAACRPQTDHLGRLQGFYAAPRDQPR